MFGYNVKTAIMAVIVVCFVAAVANGQAADTDGMNCKTHGGFKFCEGKGEKYNKTETTIAPKAVEAFEALNKSSIQARRFGDEETNVFGYLPRTRCSHHDRNKCKQLNVDITPTFLVNVRNQNRYIAQLGAIRQRVRLAICTENRCGRGLCEQRFANVRLLAWDPSARQSRLFTDQFRIPSCCRCSRHFDI